MISLRILPSGVVLAGKAGQRLVDLADEHGHTGIAFDCRSATCGSCLVEVIAGHDCVERPGHEELHTLQRYPTCAKTTRLACQLRLQQGDETIVLQIASRPRAPNDSGT